jgi:hypothetical protein
MAQAVRQPIDPFDISNACIEDGFNPNDPHISNPLPRAASTRPYS